jgi:hypothetical protein
MGFEITRFDGQVKDELICSLCSGVFDQPIMIKGCEHTFCSECMRKSFDKKNTCPIDGRIISEKDLVPAPRVLKNLLKKLPIKCDFESSGCSLSINLDELNIHVKTCLYNPLETQCEKGCGKFIARREMMTHQCSTEDVMMILLQTNIKLEQLKVECEKIDELKSEIVRQEGSLEELKVECEKIDGLKSEIVRQEGSLEELKNQNLELKEKLGINCFVLNMYQYIDFIKLFQ